MSVVSLILIVAVNGRAAFRELNGLMSSTYAMIGMCFLLFGCIMMAAGLSLLSRSEDAFGTIASVEGFASTLIGYYYLLE
jgi:hypothetical protein